MADEAIAPIELNDRERRRIEVVAQIEKLEEQLASLRGELKEIENEMTANAWEEELSS
jgi:uncharacterized protein (UPF0335 family)